MKMQFKIYLFLVGMSALLFSGCAGGESSAGTESSAEQSMESTAEASSTEERVAEASSAAGEISAANPETSVESEPSEGIAFEAKDIEGNPVSADLFSESRLTMVNVWATYCGPCLYEMPALGELSQEYDPADFQLIGIVSDVMEGGDADALAQAKELIEQTGADYTHLLLNESLYYALLTDVSAVPTTFFVNGEGEIVDTVIGAKEKAAWEEIIHELLEEN